MRHFEARLKKSLQHAIYYLHVPFGSKLLVPCSYSDFATTVKPITQLGIAIPKSNSVLRKMALFDPISC